MTTSYVFNEVVTYLNSRGFHAKAVQFGNNILLSPSVQFIHVDKALFSESWKYFQQHQDKKYSLTDCISFIVMKKFGVNTAFTFDQHFTQAGFNKMP
jgi:predicted nucleic acid-binding protein